MEEDTGNISSKQPVAHYQKLPSINPQVILKEGRNSTPSPTIIKSDHYVNIPKELSSIPAKNPQNELSDELSENEISSENLSRHSWSNAHKDNLKRESQDERTEMGSVRKRHVAIKAIARSTIDDLIKNIKEDSEWEKIGEKEGIQYFKREDGSKFHSFKGIGEIAASPKKIRECVENRLSWESMVKTNDVIETIDDDTQVFHNKYETGNCIFKTSRDTCTVISWETYEGGFISGTRSIDHPHCPMIPGILRAEVFLAGFQIIPTKNLYVSNVLFIAKLDMKGLPAALTNLVMEKHPLSLLKIRKIVSKESQ